MQVVRRHNAHISFGEEALPEPGDDEVVIAVSTAGLCRTDLMIARGVIPVPEPIVLGHEFSGIISACGRGVYSVSEGDFVAVMPFIGCGTCRECGNGLPQLCRHLSMLGRDVDGCFAEYVRLPARAVIPVQSSIDPFVAAYAEPLCAAVGVVEALGSRAGSIAVVGRNRFSTLVERALRASGFCDVAVVSSLNESRIPPESPPEFDVVIETEGLLALGPNFSHYIRPRGTLILKSRTLTQCVIDPMLLITREITVRGVHYGSFKAAVELLTTKRVAVADLIGKSFALQDFAAAFSAAESDELKKIFLKVR